MTRNLSARALIPCTLLAFAACGGSGGGGGDQGLVYSFGSASQITVNDVELTLEVRADGLADVEVVLPASFAAVRDGDVFRIWSIPLEPGDNAIRLRALSDSGAPFEQVLLVRNAALPQPAARLAFEPLTCEPGVPVRARVLLAAGLDAPTEILVDTDRDGVVERRIGANDELVFVFSEPGLYEPRVAVKTARGALHASSEAFTPTVRCLPRLPSTPNWTPPQSLPALVDVDWSARTRGPVVLSSSSRSVYFLDRTGRVVRAHPASGCVAPAGISITAAGDVLLADSGGHRLARLAAAAEYALDPSFGIGGIVGERGSGPGQFESPSDVAVLVDIASGAQYFVASDTGNDRLQLFDERGAFLAQLGSTSSGLPLDAPTQLASVGAGVVAAVDSGHRLLRFFELHDGRLRDSINGPSDVSFVEPTSIHIDPSSGSILVGEAARERLTILTPLGAVQRSVAIGTAFTGALFLNEDPLVRLVLAGDDGLSGYDWPEDPPELGPQHAARFGIERVLAGDLASPLLERALADQLAAWLADPDIGPTLIARLAALDEFRCTSRSGDYALVSAFPEEANSGPAVVVATKRSELSGAWMILHF
ncbi:MAG: hypothetical protein ACKVWV_04705 [Planctomycetota bacterium]